MGRQKLLIKLYISLLFITIQGVDLQAYVHESRALTEQKETRSRMKMQQNDQIKTLTD